MQPGPKAEGHLETTKLQMNLLVLMASEELGVGREELSRSSEDRRGKIRVLARGSPKTNFPGLFGDPGPEMFYTRLISKQKSQDASIEILTKTKSYTMNRTRFFFYFIYFFLVNNHRTLALK